ncbi:unnamed protein product, partial [Leptidea sinapis]
LSSARRRNLIRKQEISRRKSAILSKTDRPRSAAILRKDLINDLANWGSAVVCNCLRVINFNNSDCYLIAKSCGELLLCKRTFGVVKVETFDVTRTCHRQRQRDVKVTAGVGSPVW